MRSDKPLYFLLGICVAFLAIVVFVINLHSAKEEEQCKNICKKEYLNYVYTKTYAEDSRYAMNKPSSCKCIVK